MLMNADEFDDDFGDPRSMRSGIAGLDLESSGEAKQESKFLDRPSRGRHSRKKKMAPPSMAPPTMKPPSMAPPRRSLFRVEGRRKRVRDSARRRPGRVDAVPGASPREAAPDPDAAAPAGALQASTMSGRRAHVVEGHTFTPAVAQFSRP